MAPHINKSIKKGVRKHTEYKLYMCFEISAAVEGQ